MKKILGCITIMFIVLAGTIAWADTATLGSNADTYMRDATIHGAEVFMDIRGGTQDFAGYLRFNLSGLGAIEITGAQLILTVSGGASRGDVMNSGRFALYGLNNVAGNTPQNWDEATLAETGTNPPGAEWNGVVPLTLTAARVTNLDAGEADVTETYNPSAGSAAVGTTVTVTGPALIAFLQGRAYDGGLATFIVGNDDATDRGYGLGTKENTTATYRPSLILEYTKITKAYLPVPANGATVPAYTNQLSWRNPDPNDPNDPILTSDVYLGTDPNAMTQIANDTLLETATIPFSLTSPATYYWRVNTNDPNAGLKVGNLWSFNTSSAPEVVVNPADTAVFAGQNAVFTANFSSTSAILSNKWYKAGTPAVELIPGGNIAVSLTYDSVNSVYISTLTLSNLAVANEGQYYCALTNSGGTTSSASGKLVIKRPLAQWLFDGNANDQTGVYNGTLVGAPAFVVDGVHSAVSLDGVADLIDLPDGFSDFSAGFSVTVWAKPTAAGSFARFMDFGNGPDNDNIFFCRNATGTNLELGVNIGTAATNAVIANNVMALNEWQMFVATIDGSRNVVLYKNGLPVQTGTIPQLPNVVTRTSNFIGDSNWTADALYAGLMDDMRIYNYGITADNVADMYSAVAGNYCRNKPAYDLTNDCRVDLNDLIVWAGYWLDCGFYPNPSCQ